MAVAKDVASDFFLKFIWHSNIKFLIRTWKTNFFQGLPKCTQSKAQ